MTAMTIKYNASVYTQAGWRGVIIKAQAEQISKGMAQVLEVLEIDGEAPVGYTSRTGAKRQTYHAAGVAEREVGAKKRISACEVVA